jgi:hypothetical protein
MSLVVELLDSGGRAVATQLFNGGAVVVGRGFDADFILSDAHADARHVVLGVSDEEGGIRVTDCGTLNGTRAGKHKLHGDSTLIESGGEIQIGKTWLRICDTRHAVPPALRLTALDRFYELADSNVFCVAAVLLAVTLGSLDTWLYSSAALEFSRIIDKLNSMFLAVALVAGFWGLIGRITKRRAHFKAHLSIASLALSITMVWEWLLEIAHYNLNATQSQFLVGLISGGIMVLIAQGFHLTLATNFGMRMRVAVLALIFVITPGTILYKTLERSAKFSARPDYAGTVIPPDWQFHATVGPERLVQRAAATFSDAAEQAEELRREQAAQAAD